MQKSITNSISNSDSVALAHQIEILQEMLKKRDELIREFLRKHMNFIHTETPNSHIMVCPECDASHNIYDERTMKHDPDCIIAKLAALVESKSTP